MAAPWTELDPLKRTANINFTQGRLAKGADNAEARDILRFVHVCILCASVCALDACGIGYE